MKDILTNDTFAILPGKLFTGSDKKIKTDKAVIIEEKKIKDIVDTEDKDLSSKDIDVLKAPQKTLIPGLIDAHVHTYSNGEEKRGEYPAKALTGYLALRSFVNAREDLRAGFTFIRDCSSRRYVDVALKKAIETGELQGPKLMVSGHGLSMTGGHGDVSQFPNADINEDLAVCDTPGEARKQARRQLKMGADFIKLHATGGSFGNGAKPGAQQLTQKEMEAAIEEAHKAGKKAAAHAMGTEGMKAAVKAGVDSIEHGFWMTEEIAEMMRDKGTVFVPTLTPLYRNKTRGGYYDDEKVQKEFKSKAAEIREAHLKSFNLALNKGVTIACGSDSGGGPLLRHGENAIELKLMSEADMDNSEVLLSATKVNAELLGIESKVGQIKEGMLADLLLVEGNPLDDISILQDCDRLQVIKEGTLI
ncbi:amidohydrolase family protein [Candidatus Bipolaricaulota bacterium]|nr:amidohydrolase family protein [Candidatus Bipolaricaulota bacterium]